jgi:polar amino acid transport system ATP-binding protein
LPHLDIASLSADYGTVPVLQDVSLSVERGEIVSIIGPSGSGKSTLLRVLTGLLRPKAGVVHVAGDRVDYDSAAALRKVRDRVSAV